MPVALAIFVFAEEIPSARLALKDTPGMMLFDFFLAISLTPFRLGGLAHGPLPVAQALAGGDFVRRPDHSHG